MTATRITTSKVLDERFISHLLSLIPDGITALLHRVRFHLTVGTEESQSIKIGNRLQATVREGGIASFLDPRASYL
jgi:hypothetical protein